MKHGDGEQRAEHGYRMTVWKLGHAESSTWGQTEDIAKGRQKTVHQA